MLGLIDDIIGISEVGFKAHQMNAVINVKTAEKGLRFGPSKCKTMIVGKRMEDNISNQLVVDNWKVQHVTNQETDEAKLEEFYEGKIPIESVKEFKYLTMLKHRGKEERERERESLLLSYVAQVNIIVYNIMNRSLCHLCSIKLSNQKSVYLSISI